MRERFVMGKERVGMERVREREKERAREFGDEETENFSRYLYFDLSTSLPGMGK